MVQSTTLCETRSGALGSTHAPLRRPSFALLCVLMAAESVAANVVHPVEPAFYLALGLPDWIFGAAFAAMSFGLFALAPLWGVLSDRIGRGPALAISMLLYGFSQLAFLVSTTVATILLARFAAGATCSGVGVAAMAYVAEVSEARSVGRRMSVYVAVQSCATAMGYLVGGVAGLGDPGRAFILQFFILAATSAVAWVFLGEGAGWRCSEARLTVRTANPLAAFAGARSVLTPWMGVFLAATLLACAASAAFDNSFNYYLREQFGFPTTYNGYIYAVVGVLGLLANLTLGLRLQRCRDAELCLTVVLACAAVLLAATLGAGSMPSYLGLNMLFYVFNAMYFPLMQALVIVGDPASCGKVSGVFQATRSLGMVAGSLAAGFLYELAPTVPFFAAALAFAAAAGAALGARRLVRSRGGRG